MNRQRYAQPAARIAALAMALTMAGCAQTFAVRPMTDEDRGFEQSLLAEQASEAKVALGQLYFTHNEIDKADTVLAPVVAAEPKNAQALAWYGANNCKRAASRGPWLMGFDKLYLVRECLGQVDEALAIAPDDFTVQMVHMETGLEVDMFGSMDRAVGTKQTIEKNLATRPDAVQGDALAQFYVTAARIERKLGNEPKAAQWLERASGKASAPATRQSIDAERKLLALR